MALSQVGIALRRDGTAPADIYYGDDGHLAMATDAQAVGQHARQRLMTFEGEWFLDKFAGVPWLHDILGKAYDAVLAEALFKAELLGTRGVTEITSFSVRFDRSTRGLAIYGVDVLTEYDEEVSV